MKASLAKKYIYFFVVPVMAVLFLLLSSLGLSAADSENITSLEDYYAKKSEQILEHQTVKYYKVGSRSLVDQIMKEKADYYDHYDPSSPLTSGCYVAHYSAGGNIYWDGSTLKLTISFPYSKEDMDAHFETLNNLSRQLKCDDDYETVKKVHDYLCNNFEYDYREQYTNFTDIEGFRDGRMVCQGYALATYYLLNSCGIPTRFITGYGGDGTGDMNHAWNLVRIDNKWYNLDVTWDDADNNRISYRYFLKSDADFPQHIRLGAYAADHFDSLVSTKSYPSPTSFARGRNLVYLIFFAVIVLLLSFKAAHKKKEPEDKAAVIMVDDYSELVFDTPENDETTDVLSSAPSDATTDVLSSDRSDQTTDVLFSITRDDEA